MQAKIKSFQLKTEPWCSEGYYGHRIFFKENIIGNSNKGELYQCTDAKPWWLKEGIILNFNIKKGKFDDLPFIIPIDFEESEQEQEQEQIPMKKVIPQQEKPQQKQPINIEKPEQPKPQRIDDMPEYWLKRQKLVAMLGCLDHATKLVIANKIKLKELHNHVIENFTLILKKSGIETTEKKNIDKPVIKKGGKKKSSPPPLPNGEMPKGLFQDNITKF